MKKKEINIIELPIHSIKLLHRSFKVEDKDMMGKLKSETLRYGQLPLPVVVRKNEHNQYECILGNEILICLKESGITSVTCFDLGMVSLLDAQLRALNIDLIRFEYDDLELSSVIAGLLNQFTKDDLYNRIPLSKKKIDRLIDLKTYDWENETPEEKLKRQKRQAKKMADLLREKRQEQEKLEAQKELNKIHPYKRHGLNIFRC